MPKITDSRGSLTFVESCNHVPFEIKRVFYLYDVPGNTMRGGHGHRKLEQFFVAMHGSLDAVLDDGYAKKRLHLDRPYEGLYIYPMVWCEINFSPGAICMVLASALYDESDYYRDYNAFLQAARGEA